MSHILKYLIAGLVQVPGASLGKTRRMALSGKAMETAAPWKPWKNELLVFPPFPPRLENSSQTTLRVSHSSHSFYCCLYVWQNREREETLKSPNRTCHLL